MLSVKMPAINIKSLCFLVCFVFCLSAHSQDVLQNRLDSFSARLITGIRAHETPRALLTTDKSIFGAGETIWFKASLLNAVSQKVTTKSKYLFVDLVNENDQVIKSVLLDVYRQQLNGKIILPYRIPGGYYFLRAYTGQIARGDINNCSVKSIYVANPNVSSGAKMPASTAVISKPDDYPIINFYPEGGSLITGANSTVAFHICDKGENPIAAQGVVRDNLDSVVARFTASKDGLGKFTFSPSRHRRYKAYITWNGKEIGNPLPAFNFNAAQLSVASQSGGSRLLRVLLEDSIYSTDFTTYIVGISKDSFCFASIGHGQYELSVPDQRFPEGIATFYLFDTRFKLLSERSIYIRENNVTVKASVDKNSYAKRSKVTLNISVSDKNNQPVPSLFSVAVTDSLLSDPLNACNLPNFSETDKQKILNNLLLARMQCFTDEDMDLVMLLNNNSLQPPQDNSIKAAPANNADSLLAIKGTVLNEKNEPAIDKIVTLLSSSGNGIFETDTTDDNGRFYFPFEGYPDSTQFNISVKSISGRNQSVRTLIDSLRLPVFKTPASLKQYSVSEPIIARYRHAYMTDDFAEPDKQRLPAITLVSKRINYDASKRVSQNSAIITSEAVAEGTSVGNAVLGVAGLHMLNGFLVINGLTQMAAPNAGSEPVILVDGVQVPLSGDVATSSPAMAYLNSLNIKEVEFIEILRGADGANYGLRGGNGVILINMSNNRREKIKTGDNNSQNFYARGIANPALFPLVNYDKNETTPMQRFDNRSTIFWNGSVLAGAENKVTFSFYTSDVPATYKVIISGITVHGDIVYKTLTFSSN